MAEVTEFPSNSIGAPIEDEPTSEATPVVQAQLIEDKPSFAQKLKESVFGIGADTNLRDYLIFDLAVPAVKDVVSDLATSAVDMLLFGESRHSHATARKTPGDRTSYTAYYANPTTGRDRTRISLQANRSDATPWGEGRSANSRMIFATRRDAEDVLDRMSAIMEEYGVVSVADYLNLCGIRAQYTDNSYGWRSMSDIQRMRIVRVREGYTVETPYAIEISRR